MSLVLMSVSAVLVRFYVEQVAECAENVIDTASYYRTHHYSNDFLWFAATTGAVVLNALPLLLAVLRHGAPIR